MTINILRILKDIIIKSYDTKIMIQNIIQPNIIRDHFLRKNKALNYLFY